MVKRLHTEHSWGKPFASVWASNSSNSDREAFLMETAAVYPYFDRKLILKCHLERGCCRWQGRKELQPFQAWTQYPPCGFQESWVGNSRTSPTEQLCNLLAQLLG